MVDILAYCVFPLILLINCLLNVSTATEYSNIIKVLHIYSNMRENQSKLAMLDAINDLRTDQVIPSHLGFSISSKEACTDTEVYGAVANASVNVIFGPFCSEGMTIAALYASYSNIPVIGYVSVANNLGNKTKYPTLIRTSFTMGPLGVAVKQLLLYYQWRQVAIIRGITSDCDTGLSGITEILKDPSVPVALKAEITADTEREIIQALLTLRTLTRIIIVCYGYEPASANRFLITAYQNGMTTSDYVFIVPYYLRTTVGDWIPWQQPGLNEGDKSTLISVYQRVLVIEATGIDSTSLKNFGDQFAAIEASSNMTSDRLLVQLTLAARYYGSFWKELNTEIIYLPFLHDSFYLYGKALNETLRRNGKYLLTGKAIVNAAKTFKFTGNTGTVVLTNFTDRVPEYFVFGMDKNGNYSFKLIITVNHAPSPSSGNVSVDAADLTIDISVYGGGVDYWPTPNGRPPSSIPVCGFSNELCHDDHTRNAKVFFQNSVRTVGKGSNTASLEVGSARTIGVLPEGDFTARCIYKGSIVFSKSFERKRTIDFTHEELLLFKQMKEMRHDNVNYFMGMVADDGPVLMILWKYCEKGSLQDIIYNDDIQLDFTFIASIIKDIINGLEYLHKSPVQVHGSLTTRNCLVDGRWTVRLTDFGLQPFLTRLLKDGFRTENISTSTLFHKAPEQLKQFTKTVLRTKPADIFSLSMVMYQVMFRMEPFADEMLADDDILNNILNGGRGFVRPAVPKSADISPALIDLMRHCWSEDPSSRPLISEVKTYFTKSCGKIIKVSLMDHVMSMLEKYATNLEKLVDERTQQLVQERKRADQLLYQMLPRIVADKLKIGEPIYPETYDCVTIYFSDIVSFTVLSSMSTPMEIVTFLNKLYSEFDETILQYDVYKVETIGDAYMVVSGLPRRNDSKHVIEISDMALALLQLVIDFKIPHMPERRLEIRIGVNSGSVAAGVVGLTMPRYCLFGDTVNTASRMESSGQACKIQISQSCKDLLDKDGRYSVIPRGTLDIKGKGLQTTYWLLGKRMYGNQKNNTNQ